MGILDTLKGKFDLNTATKEDLQKIPGIHEGLASKIVELRERIGGFHSVDDLKKVEGFAKEHLEELKKMVTVGRGEEQRPPA
jgi:competence protein ComEA